MNVEGILWLYGLMTLSLVLALSFTFISVGLTALTVLLIASTWWRYIWGKDTIFTDLKIEKTLTIYDQDGHRASLERIQSAKVNQSGVTEFWCSNISADGSISQILIDNQPPHIQKKEAGDIQVCKRFPEALKKGQIFHTTLSYQMVDAFRSNPEILIHVVESKTKLLRLIVLLPESRPCLSARAFFCFSGQIDKTLQVPTILNNGRRVEITFNDPRLGAEYYLEWDW